MNDIKISVAEGGIKAVAKTLNLSVSTVSRALNGVYGVNPATRQRVQETAKAMGYVPHLGAKQLVGKGSNMIGVFIPQFEFEASSGFVDMFSPLQMELQRYGKDALFFSVPFLNYPSNRLTECMSSRSLEGCIVFPAFSESHPIMREALDLQVPCVNFEDVVGHHCSSVISDDREGGRMAGAKLLSEGHRVIGYLNGPAHLRICKERYAGFCEALRDSGIEHKPSLVAPGDFSGSSGSRSAIELVNSNPDMTALFCANDLMAMGAIMALTKHGISVPGQLSIVGYDGDIFTAYTSPPLTTVRHSREATSSRAVQLLIELLEGNAGRREAISPELVERQSIARLVV
ncbi:LacI family DNA-binding transcriptional regulator [Cohnella lupini]|uniref:LacI family transcriptional regulator n=1 Tax=Cohnella lupini TaxID=1294267 RepID=A0A3D9I4Z1_9BACL|nr:LacI family DNA-binding transcriptional regulator [Cohnella lupini]RED56818.1 LacI family transcriptional regulator [Cohnella lupini]